ncbi:uncharacterized protein METZ01_LOCUS470551 [marine metagenome]|uniref:Uncharacterized protein n=1 Tax=marine metagenome TaxID=408172 RepID=A0A383BC49_9ZZZZ
MLNISTSLSSTTAVRIPPLLTDLVV